jgi:hypothetical protein
LQKAKQELQNFIDELSQSNFIIPSLVTFNSASNKFIPKAIKDTSDFDAELITMLEEFFEKIVKLLRLRSQYEQKIDQINDLITNLNNVDTLGEFRGNLQLLRIHFNELQMVMEQYEEKHRDVFSEQAQVQIQLLEQLLLFKDINIPSLVDSCNKSIKILDNITDIVS